MNARHAAFISLKKICFRTKYLNIETDAAIKKYGPGARKKSLYRTDLRHGRAYDHARLSYQVVFPQSRSEQIDINVLLILRISLYQLRFLDRIPDSRGLL